MGVLISISGELFYRHYKREFIKKAEQELRSVSNLKIIEILRWRRERIADAEVLFHNEILRHLITEYNKDSNKTEVEGQIRTWFSQIKSAYQYSEVYLADQNGKQQIPRSAGADSAFRQIIDAIAESRNIKDIIFVDFYRNVQNKEISLALIVPVLDEKRSNPVGFIVLQINPSIYLFPLIKQWPTNSRTSETLIVRKEKNEVVFLNDLRFHEDAALNLRVPLTKTELPAVRAALGHTGFIEGVDYRNSPVFAYISKIPDSPWAMVARTDKEEIYAPVRNLHWFIVLFVCVIIIASGFVILALWNRQKFLHAKETNEISDKLIKSEYKFRSIFENMASASCFDEIVYKKGIATDYRILDVNPAYERILGIRREDVIGKLASEIYQTDQIPFFDIYIKVAETGVSKTFESFFAPAGRYLQITASRPAPGMFSTVFSDVTERKREDDAKNSLIQLFQFAHNHSSEELVEEALNELEKLTDSMISFYHFVNSDQLTLTLKNWSTRTLKDFCRIDGKNLQYKIADAGVWVDCVHQHRPVIHNDYASLPHKKGLPQGHADVVRELVVPVLRGDKVMAIMGIGNKNSDYNQKDVWITSLFADIVWDIANRKRSEEELRKSEIGLNLAQKIAHLGNWSIDLVKQTTNWSEEMYEIFGYKEEEIVPSTEFLLSRIHPDDRDRMQKFMKKSETELKESSIVFRIIRKDGRISYVYSENRFTLNSSGVPVEIYGIIQDITERINAEEIIKESEAKFSTAFNASHFAIIITDLEGRIIEVNDGLIEITGYIRNELLGKSTLELALWLDNADRNFVVSQLTNGKKVLDKEYRFQKKNGEAVYGLFSAGLITLQGTPHILSTIADITARKETETRLNETMQNLERSNQELEQFAYVASHDLQEPLRMVSSYTQLLAKRYSDKLDSDAKDFIQYAVNGATRMQQLINDLLDFSRLNTRKRPPSTVNSHSIIGRVQINLTSLITEHNALITCDELPVIIADETQMVQLFQNLISNAIKFHNSRSPLVHISCRTESDEWIFSVKDNGIGIDREFYDRIFKIFQRLHSSAEYAGTGIGLAICKRIVERHGGRIWLESEKDKGSTFYFSISRRAK